mgnify:CR=1 FL=1
MYADKKKITFILVAACDKYDFYKPLMINDEYAVPGNLDYFVDKNVDKHFIDTKVLLRPYLIKGEKDIYKCNDTHWNIKSSNRVAKEIKRKLKNTILENRVEDEVIDYIANACQTDVRQIEGTINKLLAYTALMNPKKIDLKFSNEAISDYVTNNPYQNGSISKIQKIVADYFNITVFDLKSKKKTANIAKPRHIAMYLCRVLTDEGLSRIGLEFGGRDHSTVSSSYDKITNDLKIDKKLNLIVEELKNKL